MAITLTANYSKRLGLPGYSSHQFSITLETELTDLGQAQGEATRLYGLLQNAVDREIQAVGFVPGDEYGLENHQGPQHSTSNGSNGRWSCSDKQKELILKLIGEHDLDRNSIESLAQDRFGSGVKQLNRLQASGLIGEMLELANSSNGGNHQNGHTNGNGHRASAGKGGRR